MPTQPEFQWMMPKHSLRLAGIESDDAIESASAPADAADASDDEGMTISMERREHRRFDLQSWNVSIERWDGRGDSRATFGRVMDLSAGGVRIRTRQTGIRPDSQIRVRLELPNHGAIQPFVNVADGEPMPSSEWVGWLAVSRVRQDGDAVEVAGRLVDMEAMDRGMLGLYLSTQPLAA